MIAISRSIRSLAFASAAALVLGAPLGAQEASLAATPSVPAPQAEVSSPAAVGPTTSAASVAVRRSAADAPAPMAAPRGNDRATALMIVGGAAVLTGIVIGNGAGYAISVGGAVVGLYGLYLYLQ